MPFKRVVTIVGTGAALAAWLAAAATSGRRENIESLPIKPSAVDRRGAELAEEISRLRERLRPSATPRQPGRNLFSFASRRSASVASVQPVAPPVRSDNAPARLAPIPLRLSGIAEDTSSNGVERTAIISASGQLFFAKEGESVADQYRVTRISADVVELADLADGTLLRLALK